MDDLTAKAKLYQFGQKQKRGFPHPESPFHQN
jgi:hypothetical protein